MTCAPGHRGPAHVHVHQPVLVHDSAGAPVGRLCECGEVFDVSGRALESIGERTKARRVLERGVRDALRREMEAQGLEVPDELRDGE